MLAGNTVKFIAIPNNGYEFVGWFIGDDAFPVSVDATYTFVVNKDIALVAKFKSNKEIAGHEYVDLGLPSGLKWATCNVDANVPEEFGCYYAWGEIEEKEDYS